MYLSINALSSLRILKETDFLLNVTIEEAHIRLIFEHKLMFQIQIRIIIIIIFIIKIIIIG